MFIINYAVPDIIERYMQLAKKILYHVTCNFLYIACAILHGTETVVNNHSLIYSASTMDLGFPFPIF